MHGSKLWTLGVIGLLVLVAACGDDAVSAPKDAAVDKSTDGGPDLIPRRDGAIAGGETAVPFCDRFDPSTCGPGEVCDEVIEVVPATDTAESSTQIYTGCVKVTGLRGAGHPCIAWNDRYTDVPEEVYYDPCGEGLICSEDPEVRGSTSCQPICQSGRFGDAPVGCASDSAFCISTAPYREVCLESDGCDVVTQSGCPAGKACYLRLDDVGEGLLSLCLPKLPAVDTKADHEACEAYNQCKPGSSCIGPLHLAPTEWAQADFVCRPLCTQVAADGGSDDAGDGDDCEGDATCVPLSGSGLSSEQLPRAFYGLCEL